jgi:hypothetical protein
MALNGIFEDGLFTEGFDDAPVASDVFDLSISGSSQTSGTPFGSGYCFSANAGTGPGRSLGVNLTTLWMGVRYFVSSLPSTNGILLTFQDVTGNAAQVTLRLFSDGSLQFYLGSGTGTTIGSASATGVIRANTWVYLETKIVIGASGTGSVELRINGNTTAVISASSVTTRSTTNTWVSGVYLAGATGTPLWDDWYMLDNTGSSPFNGYLGNVRVNGQVASGAGSHTQFTPTNPTNINWSNTANTPANAAEYNADGTVGDIDTYAFPNISGSPSSVLAVTQKYKVELDTAGVRTIVPVCRSGGTDYTGPNAQTPPNGSYQRFSRVWVKDPNTSSAWTVSNAQGAELGLKINS